MSNKRTDKLLSQVIKYDSVGEADQSVESRLMYSFLLKNSQSKLKQNSFGSFLGWLFSLQSIGIKTAIVSFLLFFSILNNQLYSGSGTISGTDTLFTQGKLIADSTSFIYQVDSIRADSLN